MNRKIQIMTVVLIVTLAAGAALAQGPGRRGNFDGRFGQCDFDGPGRGPFAGRMLEALDLTEEQAADIQALHEAARQEMLDLRKQLARLRNEMRGEMLEDSPNEKAVLSLVEQIGTLRTAIQSERMETRLAVRELLTDEQCDQLAAMRMYRGGRGDGFRGKARGGRGAAGRPGMMRGGRRGCGFGAGFDVDDVD